MLELGGLLSGMGALFAALGAWRQSHKANQAVNSRPSEPTIYELVAETRGDVRYMCRVLDNHEQRLGTLETR